MPIVAARNRPFYFGNPEVGDLRGVPAVEYHARSLCTCGILHAPGTRAGLVGVADDGAPCYKQRGNQAGVESEFVSFFAVLSRLGTSRTRAGDCC